MVTAILVGLFWAVIIVAAIIGLIWGLLVVISGGRIE